MKILFSGYHNPHFPTVTEYIESALRQAGNELIILDPRKKLFPGKLRAVLPALERFDQDLFNRRFYRTAKMTRPKLVIVSGGHGVDAAAVRAVRDSGVTCVLWTTDAPNHFAPLIEAAPAYDHIFCQGTEAVELFHEAGIKHAQWLPMACDPAQHGAPAVSNPHVPVPDIVFVGSYYPNRSELFRQLTGFKIGIYGPYWNKAGAKWPPSFTVKSGNIRPSVWLDLYRRAKIVIIAHYQDDKIPCYQASPKVFESLACGAFVLVDRQRDVFSLFTDEEHLVGFDNPADLAGKIDYYLKNPDLRKKIAEKGQSFVRERHTYVHRVQDLLSKVNSTGRGNPV